MKATLTSLFVLTGAALPLVLDAAPRSSASYSVPVETVDAGGARVTSASYSNDGSLGGIGGTSTAAAPALLVKHSYIGQLYDVTGLSVLASPASVNEGATLQLGVNAVLDDFTFLALAPTAVSWSVSSGPISFIDASGLANAGIVYQNTPAVVRGDYLSQFGTLTLDVVNVGIDDFGTYAGDGIDDAWQVQYFGEGNPNAAPGADPDGDGQNNLFEYIAGTLPVDPQSSFTLSIDRVPGQDDQKNISFSPRLPSRTYTVQFRDDLSAGIFAPLDGAVSSDNGTTRTVTDLNATGGSKFYRVQIALP